MRFSLADNLDNSSGWLEGDTLRLAYVLHNKSDGKLFFAPDLPACVFRRLRVLIGGVEVHDIGLRTGLPDVFSASAFGAKDE
jgi:hypothetical protein